MFFILVAMLIVARSVNEQEARDEHNFVAEPGKDTLYSAFGEIDLREDMAMGKYPNTK
jgi:hypothetical protein